jgi:Domain of unknown function (DUF4287)
VAVKPSPRIRPTDDSRTHNESYEQLITTRKGRPALSYQAYLDAIEAKTGKTPQQLLDEAAGRGYGPDTKATVVVDWLKEEYGVGRGHAMALYGGLKNGPVAPEKHVGSSGSHRDESATLRLDGVAARASSLSSMRLSAALDDQHPGKS